MCKIACEKTSNEFRHGTKKNRFHFVVKCKKWWRQITFVHSIEEEKKCTLWRVKLINLQLRKQIFFKFFKFIKNLENMNIFFVLNFSLTNCMLNGKFMNKKISANGQLLEFCNFNRFFFFSFFLSLLWICIGEFYCRRNPCYDGQKTEYP